MTEAERELLDEILNVVSKRFYRALERSQKHQDREGYFSGQADALGFVLGVLNMWEEWKDGEQHG